jgi:hypothetical protein
MKIRFLEIDDLFHLSSLRKSYPPFPFSVNPSASRHKCWGGSGLTLSTVLFTVMKGGTWRRRMGQLLFQSSSFLLEATHALPSPFKKNFVESLTLFWLKLLNEWVTKMI